MLVVVARLSVRSQGRGSLFLGPRRVRDGGGRDRCFFRGEVGTRVRGRRRMLIYIVNMGSKGRIIHLHQMIEERTNRLFVCGRGMRT